MAWKHGSLFSGQGGFDLAAQWMGWKNVFHCDSDPFCLKILNYYWPNAISYGDITKTDFTVFRGRIDVLTGGFPCQPFSTAGLQQGTGDARYLWPEMLRAVRDIAPRFVVGENVRGLVNWNEGMVFDTVQADLEAEGYEVAPFLLPACGIGAPHRRERIWFIAYSKGAGVHREERNIHEEDGGQGIISDTGSHGHESRRPGKNRPAKGKGKGEKNERQWLRTITGRIGEKGIIANTTGIGMEGDGPGGQQQPQTSGGSRIPGRNGAGNYWANWPTQSPLCYGNDGISAGLDTSAISFRKWWEQSLKSGGNAIVPQLALAIFQALEATDKIILKKRRCI